MTLIPAFAAAFLTLLIPGGILAAALRLAGLWWLAFSGVLSIALIGASGVVAAWLGVSFNLVAVAVGTAVATGIAIAIHLIRNRGLRKLGRPLLGSWDAWLAYPLLALVISTIAIAVIAFGALDISTAFSGSYDGVFHLNATAYVLDTGDASSLYLYRINHPMAGGVSFYPAAWHSFVALLVQLTGTSIIAATNVAWIAVAGALWIPGVVLLTVLVTRRMAHPALSATVAALLSSCFAAFPYLLLDWGTLYPTGLAYCLLPAGLSLALVLTGPGRKGRVWTLVVLSLAWLVASAFAHPRSMPSILALGAPIAIGAIWAWVSKLWMRQPNRRRILSGTGAILAVAIVVGIAVWIYVDRAYDLAARPIADRLNGGPATANQNLLGAVGQFLFQAPVTTPGEVASPPSVVIGLVVLAGILASLRLRRSRWLVASWAIVLLLYILSSTTNWDISKVLTGLWYKDKYRIFAMLAVVSIPLATIAIVTLMRGLRRRLPRRVSQLVTAIVVVLIVLSGWLGPTLESLRQSIGAIFSVPEQKSGQLVDRDELALLARLPKLVPAGEVVAGNPWDGSILSGVIGNRTPLFPHFDGDWSLEAQLVGSSLDLAGKDPSVCSAVRVMGIHYVFYSPGLMWGNPPAASPYLGISRATAVPDVLTPVARSGSSVLYRITACD